MAAVDPRVESLALLRSIDATMKAVLRALANGGGNGAPASQDVAPTADLDGTHGDPTIKAKDPRDWSGEPMKGRRFSECPPEYLDQIAARFDFFADRGTDESKIRYDRLDASRARGWAQRIRAGWKPPVEESTDSGADPFAASSEWPAESAGGF